MRFARNTHIRESSEQGGDGGERIAKVIARAGICSRRDAEKLIAEGRVTLNGKRLNTPAVTVTPTDKVVVDGTPLPPAQTARLWRYHKPKGRVTTHRDPQGRPTVFEALPEELPRVISVGRLDFNTEGLLLLTNDGGLARHLESPASGWLRRYRVRAHGDISQAELDVIKDGVEIDGIVYGPIEARLDRVKGTNVWLTLGIREGKNREVRRVMEHLRLDVTRLIRLSFGPFSLGDLPIGQVEEIKRRVLAEQLGADVADTLGLAQTTGDRRAQRQADVDSRRSESNARTPQAGRGPKPPPRPRTAPKPKPKAAAKPRSETGAKAAANAKAVTQSKSAPGSKSAPRSQTAPGSKSAPRSQAAPKPNAGNRTKRKRPPA